MIKTPFLETILHSSLAFFFSRLYTTIAWLYDPVAWLSSMGQWRSWQRTVLTALPTGPTLELGHGTGHMLLALAERQASLVGIDPSKQMSRITLRRLSHTSNQPGLARAKAQRLPFASGSFQAVFTTFPSEYIMDPASCSEVWRALQPGGKFIIIPGVAQIGGLPGWLSPIRLLDRLAAWLYRVTGQIEKDSSKPRNPLIDILKHEGFTVTQEHIELERAAIIRIICTKQGPIDPGSCST